MFQVGDKIVHPMHGAGVIDSIVQKKINGVVRECYILKIPVGGMMVMIPTENSEEIGVRPVVQGEEADKIIAAMPEIEVDMTQNWNRRYRENMLRLKSGDLLEVARVVKGLMLRAGARGLSTAARNLPCCRGTAYPEENRPLFFKIPGSTTPAVPGLFA